MLHTTAGRFLQRDPIGYVDSINLYEYVGSSPIIALDPSGTESLRDKLAQARDKAMELLNRARILAGLKNCVDCIKSADEQTKKDMGILGHELNFWSNDWKVRHCLNSCNIQKMCFLGVPKAGMINFAGGLFYELYTAFGYKLNDRPGRLFVRDLGPFDGQNPLMWAVDTPGDILANIMGIIAGSLNMDCKAACRSSHLIPGPDYTNYPDLSLIADRRPIVPIRPGTYYPTE
jgi:hypothetical protein